MRGNKSMMRLEGRLLQIDIGLGSALLDMYVKCCAISKVRRVLNGLPYRNVVSWNALIAGYS